MGRILLLICGVAAAALLVGAAPPPRQDSQAEQAKATRDLAQAVATFSATVTEQTKTNKASLLSASCEKGHDQRQSDLCAQWKAADAARDAAFWSMWSVFVGLLGVFGLVWNICQGRAALRKAREANSIAQRQFEAGFRPQLLIEMLGPINEAADALKHEDGPDRTVPVRAAVKVTNIGTVPTTLTGFEICCIDTTAGMQSLEIYHFLAPQKHVWLHAAVGVVVDDMIGAGPSFVGTIMFTAERFRELRMHPPKIYGGIHHTDQLGKMRVRGFGFDPGQWFSPGPFAYWGCENFNYDRDNEGV